MWIFAGPADATPRFPIWSGRIPWRFRNLAISSKSQDDRRMMAVGFCSSASAQLLQVAVPSHQQALRERRATDHHQPRFADWPQVFGDVTMTTAMLDRLTHPYDIIETGSTDWQFRSRKTKNSARRPRASASACTGTSHALRSTQRQRRPPCTTRISKLLCPRGGEMRREQGAVGSKLTKPPVTLRLPHGDGERRRGPVSVRMDFEWPRRRRADVRATGRSHALARSPLRRLLNSRDDKTNYERPLSSAASAAQGVGLTNERPSGIGGCFSRARCNPVAYLRSCPSGP
jgi:IstB-like ATP binding protein